MDVSPPCDFCKKDCAIQYYVLIKHRKAFLCEDCHRLYCTSLMIAKNKRAGSMNPWTLMKGLCYALLNKPFEIKRHSL